MEGWMLYCLIDGFYTIFGGHNNGKEKALEWLQAELTSIHTGGCCMYQALHLQHLRSIVFPHLNLKCNAVAAQC